MLLSLATGTQFEYFGEILHCYYVYVSMYQCMPDLFLIKGKIYKIYRHSLFTVALCSKPKNRKHLDTSVHDSQQSI